ncbi:MAG: DUF2164 domain-containing protein [Holophaga sp.]|nr:DUF2164 domain-containing protein [Holophaga sp.]
MEIQLRKDVEKRLEASIQRYCAEAMGMAVGELKAALFLKFCLEEIGPSVYNLAIADAQAFFQEKVADLENTCFAKEFNHWKERPRQVPRRAGFRP